MLGGRLVAVYAVATGDGKTKIQEDIAGFWLHRQTMPWFTD